jgi:hypothetical protein
MHFADWNPYDEPQYGFYRPPGTDQSLANLAATGANWISLVVTRSQETIASTKISNDSPRTATDAELRRVIDLAHSLGMRVMLWPGLVLSDDPNHWWGQIGTAFTTEAQWQEWFASYRESINRYASFAQEAGADMLSIGIELGGVSHREDDWRRVVKEVRERYKGPITYSSLGEENGSALERKNRIKWWDAVDYIGVTYFDLTDKNDPTVAEIKAAWTDKGYIALLENLSRQFDRPILFTEIGYESADGANRWPGWMGRGTPLDIQEQADCYQATLEVLWDKPWFAGIFWWQWFAETYTGGPNDTTPTPWGKPAEEVLKRFYLAADPA